MVILTVFVSLHVFSLFSGKRFCCNANAKLIALIKTTILHAHLPSAHDAYFLQVSLCNSRPPEERNCSVVKSSASLEWIWKLTYYEGGGSFACPLSATASSKPSRRCKAEPCVFTLTMSVYWQSGPIVVVNLSARCS